jgi:hypothetical protein
MSPSPRDIDSGNNAIAGENKTRTAKANMIKPDPLRPT